MKKIIVLLVLIVCMFTVMAGTSFATISGEPTEKVDGKNIEVIETDENAEIVPAYVAALSALAKLSISKGKAIAVAQINAKSTKSMTLAKATIQIINKSTGKIKTYSGTMSRSGTRYTYSKTYVLPEKGNYYMKAIMKCYKDGVLKDTIKRNSSLVSY